MEDRRYMESGKPHYMRSRTSSIIKRIKIRIWERRGFRQRKRRNKTRREDKKRKGLSRMKPRKNNPEHRKKIGVEMEILSM